MMDALLASGLWFNLATAIGAPVSTTHSIVGGVFGVGVTAGSRDVVNMVPILLAILATFSNHLVLKGLKKIWMRS